MCLPNFERFDQVSEDNPLIGYRRWKVRIDDPSVLLSEYVDYAWMFPTPAPSEVSESDSGYYAYNRNYNNYYYNYNYYNYYNNYYYNYNYNYDYNYYNYNYYYICGIINQYGKVAIHKVGYRSEYAKVKTLFSIEESNAAGGDKFIAWIKNFNKIIRELANKYEADVVSWQDFVRSRS